LEAQPIDLCCLGIGENGHIAFNDPHVADFNDPLLVKRVALDEVSRRQQVNEGHFPDMDRVPREAMSVTCTGLLRAKNWVCSVPELRKANAVKAALEGALSTRCPATLVKTHPRAFVFLDIHSASLLQHRPWLGAGAA
jgi:glucosamine-6-phosphate deaminase